MIRAYLARRRQAKALTKLEAMRRPDADYRNRRLAQFSPERRERALRNIQAIYGGDTCNVKSENAKTAPFICGSAISRSS